MSLSTDTQFLTSMQQLAVRTRDIAGLAERILKTLEAISDKLDRLGDQTRPANGPSVAVRVRVRVSQNATLQLTLETFVQKVTELTIRIKRLGGFVRLEAAILALIAHIAWLIEQTRAGPGRTTIVIVQISQFAAVQATLLALSSVCLRLAVLADRLVSVSVNAFAMILALQARVAAILAAGVGLIVGHIGRLSIQLLAVQLYLANIEQLLRLSIQPGGSKGTARGSGEQDSSRSIWDIIDTIVEAVQTLLDVLEYLAELETNLKKIGRSFHWLAGVLGGALLSVVRFIARLAAVRLIVAIVGRALFFVAGVFTVLKAVVVGIAAAVGGSLLGIVALIAATVAAIGIALYVYWDEVVAAFTWLGEVIGTVLDWVGGKISQAVAWAGNTLSTLGSTFSAVAGLVGGIVDRLVGAFTGALQWLGNAATALFGWLGNVIPQIFSAIGGWLSSAVSGIANGLSAAFDGIVSVFDWLKDKIASAAGFILKLFGLETDEKKGEAARAAKEKADAAPKPAPLAQCAEACKTLAPPETAAPTFEPHGSALNLATRDLVSLAPGSPGGPPVPETNIVNNITVNAAANQSVREIAYQVVDVIKLENRRVLADV